MNEETGGSHRLWGGRFRAESHEALDRLNESLSVDLRLWPYDVRVATAWAKGLTAAGVIDESEESRIMAGLTSVAARLAEGEGAEARDEDVHTLVERLLYAEIGELAGKLNTGRSRNDQVATDLRLWCLDTIRDVDHEIAALARALISQAKPGIDLILPGYTHGQRAQPVRWAYVLLSHAWPLVRDRQRLRAAAGRISELPLGAAALAGSGMAVDQSLLKEALGFARVAPNGLDATGARDYVAELAFALTLVSTHASRLAGELFTYTSSEYGFIRLSDAYCTGSSLLPQKRNPDVLELARAKPARLIGDLSGILALLRGLPAGYSKDLQEDKALLFDAADTILLTLPALSGAVAELEPDGERMAQSLDATMLATDLADGLVAEGVPFREAHGMVGALVRNAESSATPLPEVPPDEAGRIHKSLPKLLGALGSWEDSIERRDTEGGSSRASVKRQLDMLEHEFGVD
jgi:argininosuccinate lyase